MKEQQILYINRLIGIQDHLYPNFTAKITVEYIKRVHYYTIVISSEKYNTVPMKLTVRDNMENKEVMDTIEEFRLNLKLKKILRHDERRKADVSKKPLSKGVSKSQKGAGEVSSK